MHHCNSERIRNVVLLSHSGAGKTSLTEAMLFSSGTITRLGKVEDGTTTSDYDPEEVRRKISLNLSLLPCFWRDVKINLVDTPGYPDFVGEVKSGLRISEAAIIVLCAASGVEVGTEQVWEYVEEMGIPCIVVVNKLDRENADFYRTVEEIEKKFGSKCLPLQLPMGVERNFQGTVDLLVLKSYIGPKAQEEGIPSIMQAQVDFWREKLVEGVVETNDELLSKYLEGEKIGEAEIKASLQEAVKKGKLVPILVSSALQNLGITGILDAIYYYLPSPKEAGNFIAVNPSLAKEETLMPSQEAPLACLVFKTSTDPYVGKLSYFRVYSGVISSNSQVWNSTKGNLERIGQLFILKGKNQEPVPQLGAGDIGAVAKLTATGTGDTLSSREHPLVLSPMVFPKPILSLAIQPKSKADLDKMGTVLPRLTEEDATLEIRREPETNEILLCGMGETHLEVVAERLWRKFGVEVKIELPKVPYKETITVTTKAEYKHKKQTGGHGQFGHVFLELEPLPRGSGFEFIERIVGGVVPKNYIPAVEKGVMEAKQEGVLSGYPVTDMRVTLYDGSYHPVDSSDISFKIAGAQALKKGLAQGQPILLEPIMNLRITVPKNFTGDIISDLNAKRARVLGMTLTNGSSVIQAQAPLVEILRYAVDLRSITQGRGSFSSEFSHYEEVPAHLTQKIIAERQKVRA